MPRLRATVCRWRASNVTRIAQRYGECDTVPTFASVIVPTYNEAGSLPHLVPRLSAALRGREWELVVVDDGSPDGTADLAQRMAPAEPVRVVRRAGKAGLASAVVAGFAN